MKEVKLWESGLKDKFSFINTIEDFENYINSCTDLNFANMQIKSSYRYGQITDTFLESKALDEETSLIYVDDNHPMAISNESFLSCPFMLPSFFEKNKERIIKCMTDKIFTLDNSYCTIPGYLFSDELLDNILNKIETSNSIGATFKDGNFVFAKHTFENITFKDVNLTEEQKEKIRNKFIDCTVINNNKKEIISYAQLISNYKKEDLEKNDNKILLYDYLSDREIDNLKYLEDNADLLISFFDDDNDKEKSCEEIIKILDRLESLGKKVNVKLDLSSRLNIIDIFSTLQNYQNINLHIEVELNEYTLEEYKKESDKLDELVSDIKNSNMSNLEKYLAVYNIVKKFKPYKENDEDKNQSRYTKYLLDNDYMVCVGYANLLNTLLERVGIESCNYNTSVYMSKEQEDGINESFDYLGGHERNLINLTDSKYGIDGYFVADATWDNNKTVGDYYDFALLPIDSMQKSNIMFILKDKDYYLDVHSFDEYNEKVNILFNKEYKKNNDIQDEKIKIIKSYESIFNDMMITLKDIDYARYSFYKENYNVPFYARNEEFYINFLTDFGNYIVPKSNVKISHEIIAQAASVVKTNGKNEPDAFRQAYEKNILDNLNKNEIKIFPYEVEGDSMVERKI